MISTYQKNIQNSRVRSKHTNLLLQSYHLFSWFYLWLKPNQCESVSRHTHVSRHSYVYSGRICYVCGNVHTACIRIASTSTWTHRMYPTPHRSKSTVRIQTVEVCNHKWVYKMSQLASSVLFFFFIVLHFVFHLIFVNFRAKICRYQTSNFKLQTSNFCHLYLFFHKVRRSAGSYNDPI